ncbi:UDP-glucose 4-epimerase GalE [Akkermansiaceae bacterium]|nr:UDP-glucose 4-epimerase GalE [Akkermansiaceae bacterium]
MAIYITGAAGYVGSHVVKEFMKYNSKELVLIDSMENGIRRNLPKNLDVHDIDVGDLPSMQKLFAKYQPEAILHFAAYIQVEESTKNPLRYYRNNLGNLVNLLDAASQYGLQKFIFSSTAAVYGNAQVGRMLESGEKIPVSPYGWSKLMAEQVLADAARANHFKAIALRYFNVAGADIGGKIGQLSQGATHLFKLACEVATGRRAKLSILGDDYLTRDGTGVRDYIHVDDLAYAHLAGLNYLDRQDEAFDVFNVGYGNGYSVMEVVQAFSCALGRALPYEITSRRSGDLAEVVADNAKILKAFDWAPKYEDINIIVKSALDWEIKAKELGLRS